MLGLRRVIYPRQKVSRPCTTAREALASDVPLSPSRELQYKKIAALDLPWQRRLDELGASLHQVRWVSSPGPGERRTEVDLRCRAMLKFLEGKSEFGSFKELRESRPTYDPYDSAVEIPPRTWVSAPNPPQDPCQTDPSGDRSPA